MSFLTAEQNDEVEALQAIYPEEFVLTSMTPLMFKIHLRPNPTTDNHGKISHTFGFHFDEYISVGVFLVCDIPERYPEVLP